MPKIDSVINLVSSVSSSASTLASQVHDLVTSGLLDTVTRDERTVDGERHSTQETYPESKSTAPEIVYLHSNTRSGRPCQQWIWTEPLS